MSLLSSFASDFNRTITIWKQQKITLPNGEVTKEYTSTGEQIPCLIMLNKADYKQIMGTAHKPNQMEYLLASHNIRLEF